MVGWMRADGAPTKPSGVAADPAEHVDRVNMINVVLSNLSTGFHKCGYGPGRREARPEGAVPEVGAGFIPARLRGSRMTGGDNPRPYSTLASSFEPAWVPLLACPAVFSGGTAGQAGSGTRIRYRVCETAYSIISALIPVEEVVS